ncbi:Ubiquitin-protein ligase E3A [Cryptotermes secundus]|nr:ubiquitin-protein ligase E3A isoform X2 [Cryptotermes secundus]PNF21690.1 Ubiquitin-protein ligase E3A [Cryptotermes secundus]PNF21691.1 Ubiquitin-protein ligase E3A [Cryptotermes secundus]
MKRAAAKKLIERYFYQLIDGCGNSNCDNEYCASSGKVKNLTPNQAAAQAIQLFSQEAKLCDAQPTKVARTQSDLRSKNNENGRSNDGNSRLGSSKIPSTCNTPEPESGIPKNSKLDGQSTTNSSQGKEVPYITEEKLLKILETCKQESSYSLLIRTLGEVYSSADSLSQSFLIHAGSSIDAMLDKAPKDLKNLKKEDVRTMEGDLDKDEDSQEVNQEEGECSERCQSRKSTSPSDDLRVDIPSLRRAYKALFEVPGSVFESALVHALRTLSGNLELDLRLFGRGAKNDNAEDVLNVFVIVLEIPALGSSEYLEMALPLVCKAASHLPLRLQARLAQIWARHCRTRLKGMLEALQQLITLKVISGQFSRDYCVQDEETITAPTKLMKVVYYANILAGELDPPELRQEDNSVPTDDSLLSNISGNKNPPPPQHGDPLGELLQVNVLDSRCPYLPFTEFYNEPLSDAIEMDKDFAYYRSESPTSSSPETRKFSFMNYAFILTPATKTLGLYYDNRIRMYSERRMSFFHSVVGQPTNPYLRLKVRRDHIIDDALVELEMVAMENPKDLKKQLVVEFEGEQGIDEGGVSKEFFQLIVEEIFNPDYGMFTFQNETQTVWFNPTSFESDAQFTLIGIVLGLAIYNNIILDVHFPMVVYRKLMGKKGTFYDLEDWNQTLFTGLKGMLEYEADDMEETFVQTFRICYQDVFGTTFFHELKEGGDQIYVCQDNKKEFIDLYADFLLNKSVEKQFRAFRRGFQMVTDESPLHLLFRPEEVEQLVCGSKNFDFNELEEATEYDGGYTLDSPTIRNFWEIVHKMSLESKRKLLQFATGSDRVPVGGLSKLKLIIARNGPDSDRLPTAHTCFNVLLLPEYESKEKLNDRLMKAINYSKGFGML